jgi:hypothetical protein
MITWIRRPVILACEIAGALSAAHAVELPGELK